MSEYRNHDPAGSSSGQQQGNGDEQNVAPFFTNYNYQDPSSLGLGEPSTTTYHDPTSWSFGDTPSQPCAHMQPTANTSSTFPNQYHSDMSFNGTAMGNLVETSPSNSFFPMNGASQAAHQSLAQPGVGFGDIHDPVAEGGMGTGQIAGDGQNLHFHHQQVPPGNYVPQSQWLDSSPFASPAMFQGQQQHVNTGQHPSFKYQQPLAQTAGGTGLLYGNQGYDASYGNERHHALESKHDDSQERHMAGNDVHGQVQNEMA